VLLLSNTDAHAPTGAMNAVAGRYAHLVLALGQHDPDYVDAFYGPAKRKTQAEKEKKSLDAIGAEAAELSATLTKTPDSATEFLESSFTALPIPQLTLAPRVRTITHLSPRFLRRSIKTN
jgi:hypothetical protein